MKTRLLILTGLLALFVALPVFVNAQDDIDKRIEEAQKEVNRLKLEKLKALEEQQQQITKDINAIKAGKSVSAAPERAPEVVRAAAPGNSSGGTSGEASGGTSGSSSGGTSGSSPGGTSGNSSGGTSGNPTNNQNSFGKCQLPDSNLNDEELLICDLAEQIVLDRSDNPTTRLKIALATASGSLLKDIVATELARALKNSPGPNFDKAVTAFLLGAEAARLDKQAGSDSKSSGTTSLAVKGGVPAFLSWAMENGAVEGARDGTALTFRLNPIGLADSLSKWGTRNDFIRPSDKDGLDNLFRRDDGLVKVLRNMSVGFSFDITRGVASPLFTGDQQQLSAVSVRYQFLNERDPLNPKYKDDWTKYRDEYLQPFSNLTAQQVTPVLFNLQSVPVKFFNADLNKWFDALNSALEAHPTKDLSSENDPRAIEEIRAVLEVEIAKLPLDKIKNDSALITALNTLGNASIQLNKGFNEVMRKVANGRVISFEYTNYRNVNAPDLSNLRAIVSKGFWDGADLTFNGSLTFFNKKPAPVAGATVKRIRDFDFTLQVDIPFSSFIKGAARSLDSPTLPLPPPRIIGIPVLTFAGKYQRLASDAVMPDGAILAGSKGDLGFGQAKLTIPINFAGVNIKLPLSVTFSNRTDLIKEKEIRGNFGFTFDIDPFFNALKDRLFPQF